MKHYCPTGRRNHGRTLKRLLDTWDRNGSTSGPIPWKIYDDDDGGDDDDDDKLRPKNELTSYTYLRQTVFPQDAEERAENLQTTDSVLREVRQDAEERGDDLHIKTETDCRLWARWFRFWNPVGDKRFLFSPITSRLTFCPYTLAFLSQM